MHNLTRRAALGAVAVLPLARPAILCAQSTSKSVKIGLLSDMNGPYRANGGPGAKIAAELVGGRRQAKQESQINTDYTD